LAKVEVSLVSVKVKPYGLKLSLPFNSVDLIGLNFGLSLYLDRTFHLKLLLSLSLS